MQVIQTRRICCDVFFSTGLETLAEKSGVTADKFALLSRESLIAGVGETLSMVEALQQKQDENRDASDVRIKQELADLQRTLKEQQVASLFSSCFCWRASTMETASKNRSVLSRKFSLESIWRKAKHSKMLPLSW